MHILLNNFKVYPILSIIIYAVVFFSEDKNVIQFSLIRIVRWRV